MAPQRKARPLSNLLNNALVDLPTPINISSWWNFGSLLGLCLITQISTGVFLAIHYIADSSAAFSAVAHICTEVNYGWLIRNVHANGASIFFICLYIHIARGLYYGSYINKGTWYTGVIILLLVITTAFVGYILPWGQISYWGATVISNLFSAIPLFGESIIQWIWGGFSVGGATLVRFYSLHFLLPFIVTAIVLVHLILLHDTGSSNPAGINPNIDKIPFHPYFTLKDFFGFAVMFLILVTISIYYPYYTSDPDNFISADALATPAHIKPEWYFLFAYAILRSIPNKLGGVIALVASILVLLVMPILNTSKQRGAAFRPIMQLFLWLLLIDVLILTWIGAIPVEQPYIIIGQIASAFYFSLFLIFFPITGWVEKKLFKQCTKSLVKALVL